ncbi:MAG: hypothetical protein DME47_08810 [Verrucomicrobia bacterium]|nr:MAG: hypothetical protein DME47_08810 [Verrucomicrobiota bacterium]
MTNCAVGSPIILEAANSAATNEHVIGGDLCLRSWQTFVDYARATLPGQRSEIVRDEFFRKA